MGNAANCESRTHDYFVVELKTESKPHYDEEKFIDRKIEFIEETEIEESIELDIEGEDMVALCSKDQVKEDIELCRRFCFCKCSRNGFYLKDLFVLNENLYSENEMASALDLTELFIINQSNYA